MEWRLFFCDELFPHASLKRAEGSLPLDAPGGGVRGGAAPGGGREGSGCPLGAGWSGAWANTSLRGARAGRF